MGNVKYLFLIVLQFAGLGKRGNYKKRYHSYLRSRRWKSNRQLIGTYRCFTWTGLRKMGWYCEECHSQKVLQVHHEPMAYKKAIYVEFLPWYWKYFKVLCRSCHAKKGGF